MGKLNTNFVLDYVSKYASFNDGMAALVLKNLQGPDTSCDNFFYILDIYVNQSTLFNQ